MAAGPFPVRTDRRLGWLPTRPQYRDHRSGKSVFRPRAPV